MTHAPQSLRSVELYVALTMELINLPAKRNLARFGLLTNIGMKFEELPHSLAPQAPSILPLLTRGKVADQDLKTLTRGESAARLPPLFPHLHVVRSNVGAALRAYVLQTLHRLA